MQRRFSRESFSDSRNVTNNRIGRNDRSAVRASQCARSWTGHWKETSFRNRYRRGHFRQCTRSKITRANARSSFFSIFFPKNLLFPELFAFRSIFHAILKIHLRYTYVFLLSRLSFVLAFFFDTDSDR